MTSFSLPKQPQNLDPSYKMAKQSKNLDLHLIRWHYNDKKLGPSYKMAKQILKSRFIL